MIKLRPYQQKLYDDIFERFKVGVNKLCVQLETGGGKSIIIGKLANDLSGRTLILTHRAEILEQNKEWLNNFGHLTAKENTVFDSCDVAIAMVQTFHARIKKYGTNYLGKFDNIILDEVHIDIFKKVFKKIPHDILLGFTATPVTNKKKTIKIDGVEFVKEVTLSELFEDIVCGPTTQELIELGYLVNDYNVVLQIPNFENLVESASQPDGYTTQSLNDVYNNRASLKVLFEAIERYAKGKKTLIFNSTTDSNKYVTYALKKAGYNARLFDTVNSKGGDRKSVIEWFNDERDAILVGTNVFTTGFNVTDIECVIMNRATKSLGLFVQCVGRGSRPTQKIFKDFFTVIDLGENIHNHGAWSDDRDWEEHFYPKPPKRKRKMDLIQVWECSQCGAYNVRGELICEVCGAIKEPDEKNAKKDKEGKLIELEPMPLPHGNAIVAYAERLGESSDFAFKLLDERIIGLFSSRNIAKTYYYARLEAFDKRLKEIYRPCYFAILRSKLGGKRRRLSTQISKLKLKIDKYYEWRE